jgi:hypothetical protein
MITLQEILDNLTYGELSHVSVGGGALGFIASKDYPKIVSCLNGALTALHKRFLLRTGEVRVQQYADITTYYLRSEYAVSNTTSDKTKYIIDSAEEPFPLNIFKIEQVLSASGVALVLNDSAISETHPVYYDGEVIQSTPIFTPNFDTLVMTPVIGKLEAVTVKYRADHPRIKIDLGFDPNTVYLHIPTSILDAISLNIASRIYTPLTSGDGERSAASLYNYQYELECKRLEMESVTLDDNTFDARFADNGWV